MTSWGHQLGWDEIGVGWLQAGAAGGSSWTAQHQGMSGWREQGLWPRAGSSHSARGLGWVHMVGCPSTWPAVVMMVLAAMGPWAGILEARGAC